MTQWVDDGEKRFAIPRVDIRSMGYEKCCTRLAEYEDTGMTPEEIHQMKTELPRWIPVTEGMLKYADKVIKSGDFEIYPNPSDTVRFFIQTKIEDAESESEKSEYQKILKHLQEE